MKKCSKKRIGRRKRERKQERNERKQSLFPRHTAPMKRKKNVLNSILKKEKENEENTFKMASLEDKKKNLYQAAL